MRSDGREFDELRPVKMYRDFLKYAEGSVLIEVGDTKLICSATIENKVPPFLKGTGKGLFTAEYIMLPRATENRTIRESSRGKISGRTSEIQRLIGRSLRAVVDLERLGEHTVWIDCDVIQADGGTRTAAITGAYIALVDALGKLAKREGWKESPVKDLIAAVSVGKVKDELLLDLCYLEDSTAEVDMNVVMTGDGRFVEVQGTAEGAPFTRDELEGFYDLAALGIKQLITYQREVLGELDEQTIDRQ